MLRIEVSKTIVHVVSADTGHTQQSIPHQSKELQASDVCFTVCSCKQRPIRRCARPG